MLDYGAVARLPGGQLPSALGTLSRLSLGDDWDAVVSFLRREGFIRPNIRVRPDDLRSYLGPFTEPARTRSFRFSRDFLRAQLALALATDDIQEGVTAFMERREPEWTGR